VTSGQRGVSGLWPGGPKVKYALEHYFCCGGRHKTRARAMLAGALSLFRTGAALLAAGLLLMPACAAPGVTPPPTATALPPTAAGLWAGVNLAGADFTPVDKLPGVFGQSYTYPTHAEVDYFIEQGMNTFRVPFAWEHLQPALMGELEPAELARLDDIVNYATGLGAQVILDPHNYARYFGKVVGSEVPHDRFSDFWRRLAAHYASNPRVSFGLVNEPNTMPTEQWLAAANTAIAAIRAAGAENLILVPGNAWTGAHSWEQNWYGTPNATVMLGVVDPLDNFAIEVHQYLDSDSSGQSETCVSRTIGSERLRAFTEWLREYGYVGFLGEFGVARNDDCYAALDDMLTYLDDNSDVWMGWTYWAAGPWWGEYIFTVEPLNGADRPQMAVLRRHLTR
jgi:endoglucanase